MIEDADDVHGHEVELLDLRLSQRHIGKILFFVARLVLPTFNVR